MPGIFFSGRQTKSFMSDAVLTQTTYRFSATAVQVQPNNMLHAG